MLRNTRKNELHSVSLKDGKRSLLFSDEGMDLEIRAAGSVSGAAKAYTTGVWREWRATPTRGVYSDDGIYELSLDGSNRFRKITGAPKQGRALLNPQGDKAAAQSADGQSMVIYTVPEWKLAATLDLAKLAKIHCPDCTPTSYGWLADGNRVFVELVVVGDEDSGKADHPGTYILSVAGADLGATPAGAGAFQLPGYIHPEFIDHHFLGQLPDGRYIFVDYGVKQGKPMTQTEPFLVIAGAGSRAVRQIPLRFSIGTCYISPSGKYLAYLEQRTTPDYRSESHLWVLNLDSGESKELLATPPPNPPTSPNPNVTLNILGWIPE